MPELDHPEGDAPATTPATPANPESGAMDFEKFKTEFLNEINKTIDTRFSGFQSIIDRRDKNVESKWKAYDETLKELKSRTLSDEEREQLEQRAEAEEFAALKAENELLKLGKEYEPEIVDTFTKLLQAETPRDQLEIMKAFRTGTTSEPPTPPANQPTPATPSGNVDPNNPPADDPVDGSDWQGQFEKDPSLADRILKRLGGS